MTEIEAASPMPILAPETAVFPLIPGNPGKDAMLPAIPVKEPSKAISEYIKPSLIRYPMYDYQTGRQWFLSKTERIVVDAYLKTNNETEACRSLNAIRQAHGSTKFFRVKAVSKWLKKPHVSKYIAEQQVAAGKVNWYDKEKWKSWNVDVMMGKIPATATMMMAWKEYGRSQGWYVDTGPQVQNNTQINFVQSDGKA